MRVFVSTFALVFAISSAAMAKDVPEPATANTPAKRDYIVVFEPGGDKGFDAGRYGGEKKHEWRNRMVISIPESAVEGLRKNPNVRYIQKVLTETEVRERLKSSAEPPTLHSSGYGGIESTDQQDSSRTVASNSTTALNLGPYGYDGSGNIHAIGTAQTYRYDALSRLTKATISVGGTTHTEGYGYDRFGNMKSRTRNGSTILQPADPKTNRLQAGGVHNATYDAAGFQTTGGGVNYSFDPVGMLQLLSDSQVTHRYAYTANDERIVSRQPGQEWTISIRDLDGKVLRQYESLGDFTSNLLWLEDYIWANGRLVATQREAREGGRRHFHGDHLGTPRLVTDSSGAVVGEHHYYPFGSEITSMRQDRARGYERESQMDFTGHERDFNAGTDIDNESYLDYMHAKYYNPMLGRFLSTDPGRDSFTIQPQSWNLYSYTRNNPIGSVDPDGRAVVTGKIVVGGAVAWGLYTTWNTPHPTAAGRTIGDVITRDVIAGVRFARAAGTILGASLSHIVTPKGTVLPHGQDQDLVPTAKGASEGTDWVQIHNKKEGSHGGIPHTHTPETHTDPRTGEVKSTNRATGKTSAEEIDRADQDMKDGNLRPRRNPRDKGDGSKSTVEGGNG